MIFKSEHMTQASGSIAGVTYGRAKGGTLYRRARAIPVNPQTAFQSQVRDSLTNLVTRWTEVLTTAQRQAWDTYGSNVPVTNKLGSQITLSGQNWYISCNTPRVQADSKLGTTLGIIDVAPTMFDRGDFTTPTSLVLDESSGFSAAYTNTDDWAGETAGALFFWMGRPRNASRNFFKGPFRLVAVVEGAATPPTSPETVTAANVASRAFPLVELQRCTVECSVCRVDGRLTTRRLAGDVIVSAE